MQQQQQLGAPSKKENEESSGWLQGGGGNFREIFWHFMRPGGLRQEDAGNVLGQSRGEKKPT